jgi:hypothetical protein
MNLPGHLAEKSSTPEPNTFGGQWNPFEGQAPSLLVARLPAPLK